MPLLPLRVSRMDEAAHGTHSQAQDEAVAAVGFAEGIGEQFLMGDFGHIVTRGRGIFADGWGVGPFVILARGKRYIFEDSDRFGHALTQH